MNPVAASVVMLVLVGFAVVILLCSLALRYKRRELEHKERLAAIEKGVALPAVGHVESRAPWSPRLYLLRGLIWLFCGIGLSLFLVAVSTTSPPPSLADRVCEATWLKQAGATDEQVREVWHDTSPHGWPPVGLGLIGLVPIGVGVAYLIFYRVEGKKLAG